MYTVRSGSLTVSPGPSPHLGDTHREALGSDPTGSNPGQCIVPGGASVSPRSKGSRGGPGLPGKLPLRVLSRPLGTEKRPAGVPCSSVSSPGSPLRSCCPAPTPPTGTRPVAVLVQGLLCAACPGRVLLVNSRLSPVSLKKAQVPLLLLPILQHLVPGYHHAWQRSH